MMRLEKSSLDAGVAERRLRLRVSREGTIVSAGQGTPDTLLGFAVAQLQGRKLWECVVGVVGVPGVQGSASGAAAAEAEAEVLAQVRMAWPGMRAARGNAALHLDRSDRFMANRLQQTTPPGSHIRPGFPGFPCTAFAGLGSSRILGRLVLLR